MRDDSRTDVISLLGRDNQPPSEDSISNLLQSRYKNDQPYTRLGHSSLIVVNPYKTLSLLNDQELALYAEAGYRSLLEKQSLQPHVYDLAARIYFHMRRTGEDQSIILSGITGSGKSTSSTHLQRQLLNLSTHSKKERKLQEQITNARIILEQFGHAYTAANRSSSMFSTFQEMQFSKRGRILGTKTLTYAFDKTRVTSTPKDERSFHAFYSLLFGTSEEERAALHINFAPEHFNYLSKSKCISVQGINDEIAFGDLKSALKICGFKIRTVTQIFQLLAAILHLGNLQFFIKNESNTTAQEACVVKNDDVLKLVSAMLGVPASKLELSLTYKPLLMGSDICSLSLEPQAAERHRDSLANALYHVLFLWIVETLNNRLCYDDKESANFIGMLDQVGFQHFKTNGFEQFCVNFANEQIKQFILDQRFSDTRGINAEMIRDGISLPTIAISHSSVSCLELLTGKPKDGREKHSGRTSNHTSGGMVALMDRDCAKYQTGATDATDANLLDNLQKQFGFHASFAKSQYAHSFGINHFAGQVFYKVDDFLEKNIDDISPDFVSMLRENSSNKFVSSLFQNTAMATQSHPKDTRTIVKAQLPSKPTRQPSMKRPSKRRQQDGTSTSSPNATQETSDVKEPEDVHQTLQATTVVNQLIGTLRDLFDTMEETSIHNIIHIRPNDHQLPDSFDIKHVKAQLTAFAVPEISVRCRREFANYYGFTDFRVRYARLLHSLQIDQSKPEREQVETVITTMAWTDTQAVVGHEHIWLSYDTWKELEDGLRAAEKEERSQLKNSEKQPFMGDLGGMDDTYSDVPHDLIYDTGMRSSALEDGVSYMGTETGLDHDGSQWGDESEWGMKGIAEEYGPNMDMSKMVEDYVEERVEEKIPITKVRVWWVRFVWLMTWWIPSPCLRWIGKMEQGHVQRAWREKLTLCLLIFFFSCMVIFAIVGLGEIICPGTKTMYSPANVQAHSTADDMYMSVRGVVYDTTNFARSGHGTTAMPASRDEMATLAGMDMSYSIPPPLTVACQGLVTSPTIKVIPNNTIVLASFVHYSGDQLTIPSLTSMQDPLWYKNYFLATMNLYKKGTVVVPVKQLQDDFNSWGRLAVAINGRVYDITDYMATAKTYDSGSTASEYHYLSSAVEEIFTKFSGTDATSEWNKYKGALSANDQALNMNCLNNFFYIGDLDIRETPRCTFTNYLLLAFACIMSLVIIVKFFAALQFSGKPLPEENQDKFVICQVPCYTEGEESLRKTIDSLTKLKYDDKRKLLLIIADGMIVGRGNERPTPRIVLDVLGYDTKMDPEPLMFKSIGEGSSQLNYGKVYSGLYECEGHVVPYVVVVKVGKASERQKPGNRGKRDSQMICMNFLNKVHSEGEMTPLELEMYHQIKNVIGVDPSFYEYILMIDSDTEVLEDALSHMISCMIRDSRIVGLCGETMLTNENVSWTTMIQVYEYYISHHLSKAFESLFGSVTCLPGCFCMYRIRTTGDYDNKPKPLIISPKVIKDYADNDVDTLHKKNLLHLGEDRYLTTLMMKHFPQYKMKFTPDAKCKTVAPDSWKILLSQRRRWINSTIHNLLELMLLPNLCGFCCFSMRFVVLIDLVGTLTLPVSVVYLVYLIYVIASGTGPFPVIALSMLAGIYGLQAVIFILKRQWQHIGWMVFYIIAIPIFSFFIPVYSFWHFDDFSWGSTRIVVEDNKHKKIIDVAGEKFDEKMIPLKKWAVYEQELWEMGSVGSRETGVTGRSYHSQGSPGSRGGSVAFDTQSQYDYYRDARMEKSHSRSGTHSSLMYPPPAQTPHPPPLGPDFAMGGGYPVDMNPMQRNSRSLSVYSYSNPDQFPMRPMSQFSMPLSQTMSPMLPPGFPSDDEILAEIQHILQTVDLLTVTKKQVRERLQTIFGFDMTPKKEFISRGIEHILSG